MHEKCAKDASYVGSQLLRHIQGINDHANGTFTLSPTVVVKVQVSSQMRMNFNKILLKTTFDYYNNYKLHCNKMKKKNVPVMVTHLPLRY